MFDRRQIDYGDQDFYSQTFAQHALVRRQVVREEKPLDLTIPFVCRRHLGYNVRSSGFPVAVEIAASVSANEFDLYRLDDPVVEKICELVCDSLRQEIELQVKRWF